MPSFLLTWNPQNFSWPDLPQLAKQTEQGGTVKQTWSTGSNRRIKAGDTIFLLQQGKQGRGIIASGVSLGNVYQDAHYSPGRSADGDLSNYVSVRFDRLIDSISTPDLRLDLEKLRQTAPNVDWSPQGSGVTIPDADSTKINDLWETHLSHIASTLPRTPESKNWTDAELSAAVIAYQGMLDSERKGEPFKKSIINAQLRAGPLQRRTAASVEYRMQNISAVLKDQGKPWLNGYVPAENVGAKTKAKIAIYLESSGTMAKSGRRDYLLDAIKREHILQGIELFRQGHPHSFGDSTKFDLIFEAVLYPPKAIIGLAALSALGEALRPEDFTGGADSKCFKVLKEQGFAIVPKLAAFPPTAEEEELQELTRQAMQSPILPKPQGQLTPPKSVQSSTVFMRDPLVRAFVLQRARGICECCGEPAPFQDSYGVPFLEVHHVLALAEGGADVVENTVAVCPNCHRKCHYSANKGTLIAGLLARASVKVQVERTHSFPVSV